MKKIYIAPEMETVRFDLKDVILASILESSIPETIGGGGGSSSTLDDDDL